MNVCFSIYSGLFGFYKIEGNILLIVIVNKSDRYNIVLNMFVIYINYKK